MTLWEVAFLTCGLFAGLLPFFILAALIDKLVQRQGGKR